MRGVPHPHRIVPKGTLRYVAQVLCGDGALSRPAARTRVTDATNQASQGGIRLNLGRLVGGDPHRRRGLRGSVLAARCLPFDDEVTVYATHPGMTVVTHDREFTARRKGTRSDCMFG
jgi:hypothetical protein